MISKKAIQNILDFYEKNRKSYWTNNSQEYYNYIRSLGVMEGILLERGILQPGEKIDFKTVEYNTPKFLWIKSRKSTRKQTYQEFIIEKIEGLFKI